MEKSKNIVFYTPYLNFEHEMSQKKKHPDTLLVIIPRTLIIYITFWERLCPT